MAVRRNAIRRKAAPSSKEDKRAVWTSTWLDEAAAVLCLAGALFLLISLVSYAVDDGSSVVLGYENANMMGRAGKWCATLLHGFMGWCSLVPVVCLLWLAVFLWRYDSSSAPQGMGLSWYSPIGLAGVFTSSSVLASVMWGRNGGGALGDLFASFLKFYFNEFGGILISGAALLLSLTLTTRLRAVDIAKNFAIAVVWVLITVVRVPVVLARIVSFLLAWAFSRLRAYFFGEDGGKEDTLPKPRRRGNSYPAAEPASSAIREADERSKTPVDQAEEAAEDSSSDDELDEEYTHVVVSRRTPQRVSLKGEAGKQGKDKGKVKPEKVPAVEKEADPFAGYAMPDISLLTPSEPSGETEDDTELLEKSRLIEGKLKDFGVFGRVTEVHPGPVITLFEFEPAAGVKVGKVASLADDLAMSLRASSIRVIAPIPKRGTVGIEIPNKHRDIVRLREVLESDAFVNSDSILSVCIGKDTYGDPVVVDVSSMPHLLMAGATGTGKSVCINAILLSLLYRASPADLGLILIDPKMIELSVYEGIPHLRVPVVTNPKQARAVLQWAIDEMHRRYRLIKRFGVRSLDGYNRIVAGEEEKDPFKRSLPEDLVQLTDDAVVEDGTVDKAEEDDDLQDEPIVGEVLKPLPKLLIVIDEVADLMLSVGRDTEELITRLAQKARAAGIHLLIATQRPSVDVVTGLIKANFPSRLSFRVASRVDSRTILDSMGAEKLLGRGDMLFMQPGGEALKRVHGAYVSDGEVKRVIEAVRAQCAPKYDERIMNICEKALEEDESASSDSAEGGLSEGDYDPVYDKAVELVVQKGHASTSMIQRVFRIGYNRAARIIEMMEKEGVVGPMDGAKPREVLVQRQPAEDGG